MPVIEQIVPSRGKEFWDTLDPDNMKEVLEAVKEEFDRPEPTSEIHYFTAMSTGSPIGDSKPCYRDCLIFLLRGEFGIRGQGRMIETGCAYRVKDETWLWLYGTTTIAVMEEGEQRGACLRWTRESQKSILAERDGRRKKMKKAKKWLGENLRAVASAARFRRL